MSYTERNDYEVQFDQAITEQNREAEDIQAISRMVAERGPRWVCEQLMFAVIGRECRLEDVPKLNAFNALIKLLRGRG